MVSLQRNQIKDLHPWNLGIRNGNKLLFLQRGIPDPPFTWKQPFFLKCHQYFSTYDTVHFCSFLPEIKTIRDIVQCAWHLPGLIVWPKKPYKNAVPPHAYPVAAFWYMWRMVVFRVYQCSVKQADLPCPSGPSWRTQWQQQCSQLPPLSSGRLLSHQSPLPLQHWSLALWSSQPLRKIKSNTILKDGGVTDFK